ncbi:OPT-domain-containing protein [Meredithblackwellia eburnea MCA 4105]
MAGYSPLLTHPDQEDQQQSTDIPLRTINSHHTNIHDHDAHSDDDDDDQDDDDDDDEEEEEIYGLMGKGKKDHHHRRRKNLTTGAGAGAASGSRSRSRSGSITPSSSSPVGGGASRQTSPNPNKYRDGGRSTGEGERGAAAAATTEGKEETDGEGHEHEHDGPLFRDEDLDIDSAFAMVRKIVPESDDPTLPALTFRVFLLGSILCVFGAAISQFSSFFIILIAFPLGHYLARILPDRDYSFYDNRVRFSLNPGPFSKKEHLFLGIFSWQFLPAVVFPTLTSIAVLCLVDNNNFFLRTLGSGYDGFGLLDFSLDWSVIGGTGALYTPFFAQASYFLGLAFNMWVVTPFLYFSDFWNARSFDSPLAAHLYNSTFGRFDVREILNPDLSLNETRFGEIEPILLTPYFALSYGVSFAVLTSAITTVVVWHWDDIRDAFGRRGDTAGDIHVEMLERSYPAIPTSYYIVVLGGNLAAATVLMMFFPLQLPVWGLYLAIAMAVVFLIPVGIIAAITNTTLGLNVITEFVAGYIFPGKPIANIVFKVYGYMTLVQCIDLTADMKLGLYCKIPPRALFICQVYGTALGSIVNYSLIRGVIASKRGYLDGTIVDPTSQWSGRAPEIFMSASVIWGLVAPARFFSGQYRVLYWGFGIGALLPIIPWLLHKRYGGSFWKKVSVPLILHGSIGPPQRPTNIIIPGFLVSFASQFWALRYRPRWFEKYCYVLSSALDAGTSINALTIYIFGLSNFYQWWGNSAVDTEHCRPGS